MSILCTFPGRYGDLLWALPTMRAISEAAGEPVDLLIAGEFQPIVPLLTRQPYLRVIEIDHRWTLTPPAEWIPPAVERQHYDRIYHLGYRGWPDTPLPHFIYAQVQREYPYPDLRLAPLDLDRPWITGIEPASIACPYVAAWTETWFELKVGLWALLQRRWPTDLKLGEIPLNLSTGGRWQNESGACTADWLWLARWMLAARVVLADCSAPHVLAVALGRPVILVEPMEARWNPIFYPLGQDGPQVILVKGLDGNPTFDARHVFDALEARLHERV